MKCLHIKADGSYCHGFSIRGSEFCYAHTRDRQRARAIHIALDHRRHTYANAPSTHTDFIPLKNFDDGSAALLHSLQFPLLEDIPSVQVAITNVCRAIATQQLDVRRGGLMLYGLQMAANNLRHFPPPPEQALLAPEDPQPIIPDLT